MDMQNVYHIHTIYRVFTKKYLQICHGTYRLHACHPHLFFAKLQHAVTMAAAHPILAF